MTNGRFTTSITYTDNTVATNLDDVQTFITNLVEVKRTFSIKTRVIYSGIVKHIMASVTRKGTFGHYT